MEKNTIDDYGYLLEKMEPVEAISHLLHSRIFELLGYISMSKRGDKVEDLNRCLIRLEQISEKLIRDFHGYLDYYHLGDNPKKIETIV